MKAPLDNLAAWKYLAYRQLRKTMDRRSFLRGGLSALTGAALFGTLGKIFGGSLASAAEDVDNSHAVTTGTFFFPRLKFDVLNGACEWNVYPHADVILRQSLAKMTNINVSQEPVVAGIPPSFVDLLDKSIAAARQYRPITETEIAQLKQMASGCASIFDPEEKQVACGQPCSMPYPETPWQCGGSGLV